MKLIDNHKKWCEKGVMDDTGLCFELEDTKYWGHFELFIPDLEEKYCLISQGLSTTYWAGQKSFRNLYEYTELRQNIVLLICAMHNEL